MSTSEGSLEILRKRLDSLELTSQEKHKPWYLQPSNIVAMVALLVSIGSTFYSQAASKQETIRSKKEELRKLTISLIDLRQSVLKGSASPESVEVQSAGRQQGVYLQAAQRLVRQIPDEVSSYEYGILAEELQSVGEIARAEDYFQRAVNASTSNFDRAQALRSLAVFYFTPGAKQDLGEGRKAFARATESFKGQSDSYSTRVKALNYEAWAATEFQYGFPEQAAAKLQEARKLYNQLPPGYPFRAHLIDDLDRRVRDSGVQTSAPPSPGFAVKLPEDIKMVLQRLSADDLRWIAEQDIGDGGTVLVNTGNDVKQNDEDRRRYERLVASGLATFMSDQELREAGRKEKTRYDYGVRTTGLFERTRNSLFTMLMDSVASVQAPR